MKKTLTWLLLAVGLMPLAYTGGDLFAFVSGKTLYMRGVMFMACAVFAYLLAASVSYRSEMRTKLSAFWKSPIAKMVAVSFLVLAVSTVTAFDRHIAFLGNVERGEGFVGLFVFMLFFLLSYLVFEKKDWLNFFWVTLASGTVLFIGELVQVGEGAVRPGSITGNPIFLAAYFLFVMYAAYVIYRTGKKEGNGWPVFAGIAAIAMSIVGIFITQSRGVIGGMAIGLVLAVAYLAFHMRKGNPTERKVAKVAGITLGVLFAFGLLLFATRHDAVWQDIPGLNRVAGFTTSDASTQARLINFDIAVHSVSPKNEPIKRTLLGWGWDNYTYAWQKYYIPSIYAYDVGVFDRAHDKLLDMLVMNGALGLLSYLALWFFFVRGIFQLGKRDRFLAAAGIFFAAAFFIQNLSAFDSVVSYLAIYAAFAYIAYETKH